MAAAVPRHGPHWLLPSSGHCRWNDLRLLTNGFFEATGSLAANIESRTRNLLFVTKLRFRILPARGQGSDGSTCRSRSQLGALPDERVGTGSRRNVYTFPKPVCSLRAAAGGECGRLRAGREHTRRDSLRTAHCGSEQTASPRGHTKNREL